MQAGSRAAASAGVSSPARTASAAALAAGAKPPTNPIRSTPPAARARTPQSRAAGVRNAPSTPAAPERTSSTDTIK